MAAAAVGLRRWLVSIYSSSLHSGDFSNFTKQRFFWDRLCSFAAASFF